MARKLICLDLEMTGLLDQDEILEVACIILDEDYNEIGDGFSQVVSSKQDKLDAMTDICKEMHRSSGLWEDALQSLDSAKAVEQRLLTYVTQHTSVGDELILCGNSIHVDRRFIRKYMPNFDHILHYRMLDVTSVGLFLQASGLAYDSFVKSKSHRALDDIRESICEMVYYQSLIK
ncbi:oligoribonuclease [Gammaproteobacteria bacterium]|nr:oligoribonuclease [Gammaproteobacteria bacterium]